eukprot:1985342-Amphidinium_carterae.1
MRDEEQRSKQLVIHPSSTTRPHAAAGDYEADQWTAQEWEEYEAEAAADQGRQMQSKPKLCSAYASKDGCPKGALCVMTFVAASDAIIMCIATTPLRTTTCLAMTGYVVGLSLFVGDVQEDSAQRRSDEPEVKVHDNPQALSSQEKDIK